MPRHVIIGKGPVGTSLARLLTSHGHEVLVISRSDGTEGGTRPAVPGPWTHVAADASDARTLARLAHGAVALHQCANPRYDRWPTAWPGRCFSTSRARTSSCRPRRRRRSWRT